MPDKVDRLAFMPGTHGLDDAGIALIDSLDWYEVTFLDGGKSICVPANEFAQHFVDLEGGVEAVQSIDKTAHRYNMADGFYHERTEVQNDQ